MVLYLMVCAAGAASYVPELVERAQAEGWDVCVLLTPMATNFVDTTQLAQLTGHPVRSQYKRPDEPDVLPPADAIVVFPGTFNTINKWALGISDNLVLGILCECTGMKMPILAVPVVRKGKLAEHPAFPRSIELLKSYGVHVLYEPEKYPPRNEVPAQIILATLRDSIQQP
ncbi:MAG TPA: flavoprotein [Ktedonosporobacter sp.]|nr:flavoprotein [Ktedonosporobacter sp.]